MAELKYDELIAFEPIDSVKVLTEADSEDLARRDVSTFVISPQMRRMLVEQLLPHLRLDGSVDTKGVLVVANYGTGKTHLMSTISSVLEHADLAADLRDEDVRKAIQGVAGSFQVIRAEIGATKMGLRDIVCGELESGLKRLGVEFAFPPLEQVSEHQGLARRHDGRLREGRARPRTAVRARRAARLPARRAGTPS